MHRCNVWRAIAILMTAAMLLGSAGCIIGIGLGGDDGGTCTAIRCPEARIYVGGTSRGKGPVDVHLKKGESCRVEFRADGLKTQRFTITNIVANGTVTLDCLGGVVPVIVDKATGAWYPLNQENVNARLAAAR